MGITLDGIEMVDQPIFRLIALYRGESLGNQLVDRVLDHLAIDQKEEDAVGEGGCKCPD